MIKVCKFTFEGLECKNHWIAFAAFGKLLGFTRETYDNYRDAIVDLDPDKVYQISFDQSTTNSGIFIKDFKNTEAFMIEVSREKGQNAEDYMFDLEMFLHKFCQNSHFSHLIYERPIITDSYRSAQVLFQLEGIILTLKKRYDEFKTAKADHIENAAWRAAVIPKEIAGTYTQKAASRAAVEAIFPWTEEYLYSIGHDNDIYEAIGVMFGWFINSFDALGRPYVRGDRFGGNIGGFLVPMVSAEEVSRQLKEKDIESTWAMQNPRYSIYENLAAMVEKYTVACLELTDPYAMLALSVECNLVWMNPDKMTVVLVAANYANQKLFEVTGKQYHFVL